jgi:hypothetical protein
LEVENVLRPLDQMLINTALTGASSEFPVAIEIAVLILEYPAELPLPCGRRGENVQ